MPIPEIAPNVVQDVWPWAALLLLGGAEQSEGAQGEAALYGEGGREGAVVS